MWAADEVDSRGWAEEWRELLAGAEAGDELGRRYVGMLAVCPMWKVPIERDAVSLLLVAAEEAERRARRPTTAGFMLRSPVRLPRRRRNDEH